MKLLQFIEYTKVDINTTSNDINQLCDIALRHAIQHICIPPLFVKQAAQKLEGQPISISAVIGFPYGYATTFAKIEEIKRALEDGAHEVDVMLNIAAIKSNNWSLVQRELDSITTATRMKDGKAKLIISAGLLSTAEIQKVLDICKMVNIDFINTATSITNDTTPLDNVTALAVDLPIKHTPTTVASLIELQTLIEKGAKRITIFANNPIIQQLRN